MCARADASPIRDEVARRLRDRPPPGEVGKEISEHRAHRLDEKEGSGAEAKGRDRVICIIEAVLLAVVAVLAAWSGFAAAKWGTESSLDLAKGVGGQGGGEPGRRPEETGVLCRVAERNDRDHRT
jgi:hypothetical protein